MRQKVEAKNHLENYLYSMRSTLRDEKVAAKLPAEDKRRAQEAVDAAMHWLDGNQLGEKEEFEDKQREARAAASGAGELRRRAAAGNFLVSSKLTAPPPACRWRASALRSSATCTSR